MALSSSLARGQGRAAPATHVNVIELDNQIISPVTAQYIERAIGRSEADGATCLVIRLDTPGGLLESTRSIVKRIMNSRVPVVVYVAPSGSRAGSAGVFITLAAHVAAMAPSTNIGAAHPVLPGGGEDFFKKATRQTGADKDAKGEESANPLAEKIMNDTVAWISGIAKARGRNAEWAQKAVTESVSVTESEALKEHIIDLVAADLPDLLRQINFRQVALPGRTVVLATADARVVEIPMTLRQNLLATIVNPNVAYLLMMLGILGLIFEFTHPGVGFPGIAGVICILLALYAFQTLPVNYAAVLLIGLGLAMLVAEVKIISHGLLAVGGMISLTLGSLMLFDAPDESVRVSLGVIASMVITLSAITLFIVQRALRSRQFPVATGEQGMHGLIGEALTDLAPEGQVFVHGETWNATSAAPIRRGQAVRVVSVEGLRLNVEPVTRENPDESH